MGSFGFDDTTLSFGVVESIHRYSFEPESISFIQDFKDSISLPK
jgi:hypothetical protein